VYVKLNI